MSMPSRLLPLALVCLAGCPPPWDAPASCIDFDACSTGASTSSTADDTLPTTSAGDGIQTVTSDSEGSTAPGTETGVDTGASTGEPVDSVLVETAGDPLAAYAGDRGADIFRACVACHTLSEKDGPRAGPTLAGLFGRKIASVPGYRFSEALKTMNIVWTPETVAGFLQAMTARNPTPPEKSVAFTIGMIALGFGVATIAVVGPIVVVIPDSVLWSRSHETV